MDQVAGFRDHGYAMPLMLMADLVADQYRVKGTPGVVVTDRSHRIAWVRSSGPPPEAVETMIRALLEHESASAHPTEVADRGRCQQNDIARRPASSLSDLG